MSVTYCHGWGDLPQKMQEMIRVDHAGELGAQIIYQTQLRFFPNDTDLRQQLAHEEEHLREFIDWIWRYKVRPSILSPVWYLGGIGIGLITGVLGRKAVDSATFGIERVIIAHYNKQLLLLDDCTHPLVPVLRQSIDYALQDEMEHFYAAKENVGYPIIGKVISEICRGAIYLATKF